MSYQYCNNHQEKVKMNKLYFNKMIIKDGKKNGAKIHLNIFWCQKCEKIYRVETKQEEIKPLEIKN